MRVRFFVPLALCGLLTQGALAQDAREPDEYLRLTFEAKGRLKVSLDPKSGEVSSASLSVGKETWWLEFPDPKQKDAARKLDGQAVLLTGEFLPSVAVEERSTTPRVGRNFDLAFLRVRTLKAAGEKK